jgi:hypothetical protein
VAPIKEKKKSKELLEWMRKSVDIMVVAGGISLHM